MGEGLMGSRADGPPGDRAEKEMATMRFMMMVRADETTEAGVLPSTELIDAMSRYNEELVKAGVLLAADGLHPSEKGFRISWPGGKPTVTDGPFTEAKELIAGYWLIQVKSPEEAVEWACRVPFGEGGTLELRQIFEPTEFPAEVLPPDALERERAMRAEVERQQAAAR
ncbi:YciI family protein [Kitasatospora sp. NBC_01287]|uniref:YciI family protein n=1 Tax=Kitasatospora sp. NBC_01287 TaxID=2903573 RepID=UPI00225090F9|nr:YciI family protein [Kitasatospora sp. NBC_01287]MCX4747633.1 YciI family protein [Kitasatospora sp. NBC_01287]